MALTLHLPSELEQRLTQEARRHGVDLDAYTIQLLEKSLAPRQRRTELVALLQSWIDQGNAEEQLLDRLLAADPVSLALYRFRARARLGTGDAAGALADLERSRRLVGEFPERDRWIQAARKRQK